MGTEKAMEAWEAVNGRLGSNPLWGWLAAGALTLVAFLLVRELACWYWKINRRLAALEKAVRELENLNRSVEAARTELRTELRSLRVRMGDPAGPAREPPFP